MRSFCHTIVYMGGSINKKVKTDLLQQHRLEALVNNIADGVLAVDDKAQVVMYNAASLNLLDLNIDLKGRRLNEVSKLVDDKGHKVDFDSLVLDTKLQTVNRDLLLVYSDNTKINLYISIAPVKSSYGEDQAGGFVLLLRDITREKSLEEERNEFISVVSHELRTPIAIAEGNVSNAQFIAEKKFADASVTQMLKVAHEQILFLSTMINDLSTLSRAERGVLSVDVSPINMHELLDSMQKEYMSSAHEKNLRLEVDLDPRLEVLYSSELYVREVLQNFITNAIKYTNEGSVTLRAYQKANATYVEIEDTGIGISKQDQEKVFDKFFRSEDYRTREHSGSGLGLYITMKLMRLLKADVSLESQIDKGSTFCVVFPNLN